MLAAVDVVLATTRLPDDSGFGLIKSLSGLAITAFLCVPVEYGCFWLPAIDRGRICLGSPALRPAEFARVIKAMSPLWPRNFQRGYDHRGFVMTS
jgi:hypothetical protein